MSDQSTIKAKAGRASRRGNNGVRRSEIFWAAIMVIPFLTLLIVFTFLPVGYTFFISVMDYNSLKSVTDINYVGLQNYLDVFNNSEAVDAFLRSFLYSAIQVPILLILALLLALALNGEFWGKRGIQTLILVPYVCNIVAVAVAWRTLFEPSAGPVNSVLTSLGLSDLPQWFGDPTLALMLSALVAIYMNMSYQAVVFLAALQGVSKELYEAAEIDGANKWVKFRLVTWPGISSTTFFLVITSIIGSFQNFNLIAALTKGGPGGSTEVAAYHIWKVAFKYDQFSIATAESVVLFLILTVITVIQFQGQKKWVNY